MENLVIGGSGARSWGRRIAAAILPPTAVTLLAIPPEHPPTAVVAVVYVLSVVIAARVGGALSGAGASIVSFLALNFFFTSPLHTFAVGAPEDVVTLIVCLVVAIIVGLLLSSALEAKSKAERRELEARLLNRIATRLLSGESPERVLASLAEAIRKFFGFKRCEIDAIATEDPIAAGEDAEGEPHVVRAEAQGRKVGEIRVWTQEGRPLITSEETVLGSLATQLALALEGIRLSAEVRRAELDAQASQLKAALFSGVTHDVKTPLAAITASVTSLIDGSRGFSEADRRDHLETIKQEAERLHRVVNNLLDVARLRAGALVATTVPTPIEELMESVINRMRPLLEGRPIDLNIPDGLPEVPLDVVQIDQVLTNLLENAAKFSPGGTPITLSAVGGKELVRVTISDRGPGVRQEDRVRIFEPFERSDAAGTTGSGLGLAIANAIVLAHGGRMWASDSPAGGAAFTFELPVATAPSGREVTDAGARAGR